jgi:maltose O-acetyltransferase
MTEERFEPKHQPVWRRAMHAVAIEVLGVHPTLHAYNLAAKLLPTRTSGALRARLLRLAGFRVGAGTTINGLLKINGQHGIASQLVIGSDCTVEPEGVWDLSEKLTIGDRVTIEPGVMILTSTHELDFPSHRAGKVILSPVVIEDGAWLRARCIILPGVRVGAGAVVDVGAVVNKDVNANTRVAGVPAVVQKNIEAGR